jgi:hypothetical protein
MGYHITILRAPSAPIREEELIEAIGRMPGRLSFDQDAQPDRLVYEPAKGEQSEIMLFEEGHLWTKTPTQEFLRLMIELADLLGARVRGDALETYRTVDETYHHPDDRELIEQAAQLSRKLAREQRRRDWMSRFAPFAVFILIGWIYARFIK